MPDPVVVTPAVLRGWPLPDPGTSASKEERGRVLVIGGAAETAGAALLAAVAALRTGAGKLQLALAGSVAAAAAVAVPEALVRALPETAAGRIDPAAAERVGELVAGAQAVLVGPGLAGTPESAALVRALLPELAGRTAVLDALALAALTGAPDCLAGLCGAAVLTPNAAEMGHLLDRPVEAVTADPRACALAAADRFGAVVALGGGESWIAAPDGRVWSDASGSAGLGTSGSGDVLAGVVAGLAARGADPAQAAVWAVHVHGRAGDRLAARVGRLGYLARELVAEVPGVLTELEG